MTVVKILEVSAANFGKRGRKLFSGIRNDLERVAKYHVLSPLNLEILHVLTNHFNLAVRSLSQLVDYKMCIVSTEVVKTHRDLEAYRAFQVTLAVGGDDKPASDVVVVTDFGTLRFILYKLMTADVASSGIIIFLLLANTMALHRPICQENRHDLCFPHDERVKKLGESVLSNFHHGPLVKVIKTRGEDSYCCTHFVLLGVGGVLNLATRQLKDGLKVRINDEWCFSTILKLVKFDLRFFGAWLREHMEHRHEVVSSAELFVSGENFFR